MKAACLFSPYNKLEQNNLMSGQYNIYYESSEPSIAFAAEDLKRILSEKNMSVSLLPLMEFSNNPNSVQIVIADNKSEVIGAMTEANGKVIKEMKAQDYALRVTGQGKNKTYWVIGGDRIGAMYGGIHLGEIVMSSGLDSMIDKDFSPYIAKRGLKFNIPLDSRTPSHDDRGTSAQSNIINMWDFNFWTTYLDELARQRFNVISLWSKHPFPSMIKLEEYPDVALNDIYDDTGKIKTMTIDEKIVLWQKVMDYADHRGIEFYIITWNIHMNGALGKYGITQSKENEITKDYQRKSVSKLLSTYPKLAGIGTTAGENMHGVNSDEKEEWLWETYGKGIQDVQNEQPDRKIRFIHRYWWTDFNKINSRFKQLKDGYDMSFKYGRARIYSAYNPQFAEKEFFPNIPKGVSTWWNLRNDDIYNLRWGDAEYVRKYILNLPKGERTAGYYMGSDRFVWARESISKNPTSPRILENEKHWFSFLLWGRMGYDPETSPELLKGLIGNRFPSVDSNDLYTAWQESSKVIPLINKFHWFSWDYLWWPEACIGSGVANAIDGYHNIYDFINAPVMDDSNLITIKNYVRAIIDQSKISGTTPLQVADMLELYGKEALSLTEKMNSYDNNELAETIGDIKAMAHLGNYYSAKIRGATNLKLYLVSNNEKYKTIAIGQLEESLKFWKLYSKILTEQYIKMNISMQGVFDWDKLEKEVKADIDLAKKA
ncbi:carbohydrate-binding family 6 protein [Arenibacter echinorum]|nr:carbohydrate-binding family 6 protein [Arenibacter echinorum]